MNATSNRNVVTFALSIRNPDHKIKKLEKLLVTGEDIYTEG